MAQTPIRSGQVDAGTTEGQLVVVEAGDVINSSLVPSGSGPNTVGSSYGSVANGGTIPLPSGFTQGQCAWIVSWRGELTDTNGGLDGIACYDNGSRVVTSVYKAENEAGLNKSITANYLIIGVK